MNSDFATALCDIFNIRPLSDDDSDLYVELDSVRGGDKIVSRLENSIVLSSKPTCQLLSGHLGCGKTTELTRLQKVLSLEPHRHFVSFCQLDRVDVEQDDLDFPDLLISIISQMIAQLQDLEDIELTKSEHMQTLFDRVSAFFESIDLQNLSIKVAMVEISAALNDNQPGARKEFLKQLDLDTNSWMEMANDLIGRALIELRKKGYQDITIIVDGLDRVHPKKHRWANCTVAEYLFVNRQERLKEFNCNIVYTMPSWLVYTPAAATMSYFYNRFPPLIGMTKLTSPPPKRIPDPKGADKFREVICRRLARVGAQYSDIVTDHQVLERIIRLSGGHLGQLIQIVHSTIRTDGLPISSHSLDQFVKSERIGYQRMLLPGHWNIIDEVDRSGRIIRSEKNEKFRNELLTNRILLNYINDEEWYDINPLVKERSGQPG